jgi:hypothetical protein
VDLRLLFAGELQTIEHLFEALLARSLCPATRPFLIRVERQSASSKTQDKDQYCCQPHLPFAFAIRIHDHLSSRG